jgi:hypothetical protein
MKHGIITSACVLLWVLAQAVTAGMTHVDLPQSVADAFGSKCLNGQAPSYEIRTNSSSAKWILFLEGGGWCNGATANATIDACAGRAGFKPLSAFGSSTEPKAGFLPKGGEDFGGVLGEDAGSNPDFYSWNAVFIHYCDGASFGSSRPDPIPVQTQDGKPAQMWMRGSNNFDGVIQGTGFLFLSVSLSFPLPSTYGVIPRPPNSVRNVQRNRGNFVRRVRRGLGGVLQH